MQVPNDKLIKANRKAIRALDLCIGRLKELIKDADSEEGRRLRLSQDS